MKDLLASKVFNHTFDFDEWPATSNNTQSLLRPYNGSIFNLRHHYKSIFPDLIKEEKKNEDKKQSNLNRRKSVFEAVGDKIMNVEEGRQYKIRYSINILPSMSEKEGLIIAAVAQSEELEIFFTEAVKDLVNYKWQQFAKLTHWVGWITHMIYIVALQSYVTDIYLDDD